MKNSQEYIYVLIGILLFGGCLYYLAPVLTPFMVAFLLAYLANPLANKLVTFDLPRLPSVLIVFLLVFSLLTLFILLLIPFAERQISTFLEEVPAIINWTREMADAWLPDNISFQNEKVDTNYVKNFIEENWTKAGGVFTWLLKSTLSSWAKIFEWTMNLLLIPVVTFYLLCDWDLIISGIRNLLPRRAESTVVGLINECDEVLSAFLRGQLLVMLSLAIIYALGLSVLGVQMGMVIGIVAGLLSIIPYLGFLVGIVIASVTAYFQFHSISTVLLVCAVFILGQTLDHIFLTPKLVGNRIGLHPVAVIFSILAGGCLFGFIGALFALPVAAMLMVWIRYLHRSYHSSKFYQSS